MVASGTEARAGSVAALVVNERAKIAACKTEAEAAGPTAFVLRVGSCGKRSVELTVQDFISVRDCRWITDRVVNGYFYLPEQRANRRGPTSRAVFSFWSFFYNRL
jgi:Ulp1 family protease